MDLQSLNWDKKASTLKTEWSLVDQNGPTTKLRHIGFEEIIRLAHGKLTHFISSWSPYNHHEHIETIKIILYYTDCDIRTWNKNDTLEIWFDLRGFCAHRGTDPMLDRNYAIKVRHMLIYTQKQINELKCGHMLYAF